MPNATEMRIGVAGLLVAIFYHATNKRILSADYTIPAGVTARIRIYDTDISATDPVYTAELTGPQAGSQTIPGNYRMVSHPDGYDEFPVNILWTIEIQKTGN